MLTPDTMRRVVHAALIDMELDGKAAIAASATASMLNPPRAFPGGALVIRFDAIPHSNASFYVGLVGDRVFYLTESPEAFAEMVRASSLRVDGPETAVTVARAYVETTRSMREFSGVVAAPDDITWAPGTTPEQGARLAGRVTPPAADAISDGFEVVLYAIRGAALERRILTVRPDGNVRQIIEEIASDLPVAISM